MAAGMHSPHSDHAGVFTSFAALGGRLSKSQMTPEEPENQLLVSSLPVTTAWGQLGTYCGSQEQDA